MTQRPLLLSHHIYSRDCRHPTARNTGTCHTLGRCFVAVVPLKVTFDYPGRGRALIQYPGRVLDFGQFVAQEEGLPPELLPGF